MPNNHRGYPIASNHRPTPRLAQALARHVNVTSGFLPGESAGYTEQEAAEYIQEYRGMRDYPKSDEDVSRVESVKAPIQDAFSARDKNTEYKKLSDKMMPPTRYGG